MKISSRYYQQTDTLMIAKQLLGAHLITEVEPGQVTIGRIVETEAYCGINDKASHAYNGRHTARTAPLFEAGGIAYIYLCYGIHHLFNIVIGPKGSPLAVLIRALEPISGMEYMMARRSISKLTPHLTAGPGRLSQAMGLSTRLTGASLKGNKIWLEKQKSVSESNIIASPRVGVAYAEEDALKPWRFRVKNSKWTSQAK